MPVVVTGASGLVGRALVPTLAAAGHEVRAVVRRREAAPSLRDAGAKVAVGDLGDPSLLETVLGDAHTVCHLVGGLDLPAGAHEAVNLEPLLSVLEAARPAGLARVLFLSYPGASPASGNAYLRAKGMAEEEVRGSGLQHVIVRSTHVYGPGSAWLAEIVAGARRPLAATVLGPGTQRMAPVFVEDVARVLAAADDRATPVQGTFGLQGPDVITADELVDLVAGRRRRKIHLSPGAARRAARLTGRRVSSTAVEVMAADSLADGPDAAREFGLVPRSLAEGLRASVPSGR